jgi:hypothetical protein
MPVPPEGGNWAAGVEVAFNGTDLHAGVNVARVNNRYMPFLIGYRIPLPSWCEYLETCVPVAS